MKLKLLSFLIFLSFLVCHIRFVYTYGFVFQLEIGLIIILFEKPDPYGFLFLIPVLGQILLLVSLFLKNPKKLITIGIILCSTIVIPALLIGIIGQSAEVILSTLPFITFTVLYFILVKKKRV